jgi:hypothetical protein
MTNAGDTAPRSGPCVRALESPRNDPYWYHRSGPPNKGKTIKYLVPPIVIPVLVFVGIVAYAMLRPPIIAGHLPAPSANSQAR